MVMKRGNGNLSPDVPVLLLDRSGGPWAFRNGQDAADWMEAIDVADGEYHGYDANGYVLYFSVVGDRVLVGRSVDCAYEDAVEELRVAMINSPVKLSGRTLGEMIDELL